MATGRAVGTGLGGAGGAFFGVPGMLAGSALGGLLGGLFDNDDAAQEAIKQALAQYEGIVPPDLAQAIVFTQFQQGGQLTPQQMAMLPIEAQEVILLQETPETRQRQSAQLQALEQLAQSGMGAQERLALEESRLKAAQNAQARQAGLLQKYSQMGQGGGPASLAAQLGGLQQSSQDEMLANMRAAAMQQENRRAAIQAAMSGAERLRQQDLGVQQSNVEAQRQRQLFDIQNQLARQKANVAMRSQADIMNLQRQQDVMDRNIAMQNQELLRRKYTAPNQMFQNQLALAQSKAGVYGAQGKLAQERMAAEGQNWANIGGGLLGLAGAAYKGGAGTESLYPSFGKTQESSMGDLRYKNPRRFSLFGEDEDPSDYFK